MGDALLQKTYTADFLTKKVKKESRGSGTVLCKREPRSNHSKRTMGSGTTLNWKEGISYMQELGLTFYGYGSEVNPFSCRVVCGKCGAVCGKKSWKSRGVEFWQCNNRSKKSWSERMRQ